MADPIDGLHKLLLGGGSFQAAGAHGCRLTIPSKDRGYADAQLDDTARLSRGGFAWRPPVHLQVRARASHPAPRGTLGFGFWNDPFALSLGFGAGARLPAAPRALWFFYGSRPNDFTFVPGGAGSGWRAMAIDSPAIPSIVLAPLAAGAMVAARLPPLRARAVRAVIGRIRSAEALVGANLDTWHDYSLDWRTDEATFRVDGRVIMRAVPPPPPLGFVAWIDNQYAILSSTKGIAFGTIPTTTDEWLEIRDLAFDMPSESFNVAPAAPPS